MKKIADAMSFPKKSLIKEENNVQDVKSHYQNQKGNRDRDCYKGLLRKKGKKQNLCKSECYANSFLPKNLGH